MSRAHQLLLKKLCHHDETLERAKAILNTASIKTAPGSGYELGQGSSGLSAICAYIAAEELGDTDVTEQIAQAASCLKPKLFKTALNTVKGALSAAAKAQAQAKAAAASPAKAARTVTYNALLGEKKIGRKGMVLGWMQDAERALMATREARRRFASYDAVTVAVFCWTCQLMGLGKKADPETLLGTYGVREDQFNEITEALHEFCQETAKKIEADVASLRATKSPSKSAASPSKVATSPTKAAKEAVMPPALPPPTPSRNSEKATALTRSPSKSALRAPSADLSPRKTPSHKRKVVFDGPLAEVDEEEFDALATPSKRQKFSSPLKEDASTPRKSSRLAQISTADEEDTAPSSARKTLELLRQAGRGTTPGSAPSTPRKPRIASQPSSVHSTRSGRSQPMTPSRRKPGLGTIHEDEERVGRRRYRPAFADTQQWMRADVRLERTLKPWAERWRELVGRCGGDVWEAARTAGEERRGALAVGAAS